MNRWPSLALLAALLVSPTLALAQAEKNNRIGIVVAPTNYNFANPGAGDAGRNGSSLEWAVYYDRVLSRSIATRLEVRLAERGIDATFTSGTFELETNVWEQFIEIPLLIESYRRYDIGGHALEFSIGAGICYGILVEQQVTAQPASGFGMLEQEFGDYQKIAVLADAGVSLDLEPGQALLMHFRYQEDLKTFSEADGGTLLYRYQSWGFYAGFQIAF